MVKGQPCHLSSFLSIWCQEGCPGRGPPWAGGRRVSCSLHPVGTLLSPLSTLTPRRRHTPVPRLVMWASETAVSFSLWLEAFLSHSLTSDHRRQPQLGSVFHPAFSFGSQGAGLGGRDRLEVTGQVSGLQAPVRLFPRVCASSGGVSTARADGCPSQPLTPILPAAGPPGSWPESLALSVTCSS